MRRAVWKAGIVTVGPLLNRRKILLQALVFAAIVVGELLWVILVAETPGEAVVLPSAKPVELVGIIGVGAIVADEQLAIRRECRVVRITRAVGEQVGLQGWAAADCARRRVAAGSPRSTGPRAYRGTPSCYLRPRHGRCASRR